MADTETRSITRADVGLRSERGPILLSVMLSRREGTAQMNWDGFLSVLECRSPGA